ncbi:alpha/beta fold hydrolase [Phenylobacterium montanum]|uniref:Alpha/beta hydrolase n=1 Tax=Phenylobacterium montanum TaxID=2823693 RepID=A0A975G449_9CAUL|nr:alpha/beta fold hydrolase [Caulobacter sp. S6]QUD90177.1 alpha/beta hydrolase [Caulobacter sp. S6]
MTTFVLVTGAWHGSWCWKRVRDALIAQGHAVFTPTLTGLCERSHLLSRDVDLHTHINDVTNLIRWEELTDVVLVGHSYGGCVISGVADRMGERIAALIYLDAFVLENGQSLHDVLPVEHRHGQLVAAETFGDGWRVPPIPAEVFNVNATDRSWVDAQCTDQPLACFQQKLRLDNSAPAARSIHYIYASDWEATPFTGFYERAKVRGWSTSEIACGHDIMLDRPEELTAALLRAAAC